MEGSRCASATAWSICCSDICSTGAVARRSARATMAGSVTARQPAQQASLTPTLGCTSERSLSATTLRPAACLLALLAFGCGPMSATSVIGDAEAAVRRARAADGERLAPYETVSAELYLEKAREEQGRAQYGAAMDLARQSVKI